MAERKYKSSALKLQYDEDRTMVVEVHSKEGNKILEVKPDAAPNASNEDSTSNGVPSHSVSLSGLYLFNLEKRVNTALPTEFFVIIPELRKKIVKISIKDGDPYLDILEESAEVLVNGAYFICPLKMNDEDLLEISYMPEFGVKEIKLRFVINSSNEYTAANANKILSHRLLKTSEESQRAVLNDIQLKIDALDNEIKGKESTIKKHQELIAYRVGLNEEIERLEQELANKREELGTISIEKVEQLINSISATIEENKWRLKEMREKKSKITEHIQQIKETKQKNLQVIKKNEEIEKEEAALREQLAKLQAKKKSVI